MMRDPANIPQPLAERLQSGTAWCGFPRAAGLPRTSPEPGPVVPPVPDSSGDGRVTVWSDACAPGGMVCAQPVVGAPDGICGMPVESEPCAEHPACDDWPLPADVQPETLVWVTPQPPAVMHRHTLGADGPDRAVLTWAVEALGVYGAVVCPVCWPPSTQDGGEA